MLPAKFEVLIELSLRKETKEQKSSNVANE